MKKRNLLFFLLFSYLILFPGLSISQDKPLKEEVIEEVTKEVEAAELAKKTANPLAAMISLPVQFNFNFGLGEYNRFQFVTNFMPVLPFRVSDKVNAINRIIIPFIYQPEVTQETGGTTGIGNINYSCFFTPSRSSKIIWGVGPAMSIPTRSSEKLGDQYLGVGPTLIALMMPGNWAIGVTANNVWSYEGGQLNSLFAQIFIVYTFKSAWFLQTMPTITANWNAPKGQQWSVPLGANVGKVVLFGKLPVKFIGGGGYFVASPDNGAKWQLFAQAVFLFPK